MKNANKRRELKQYDWDFRECPKDQGICCLIYEFAREILLRNRRLIDGLYPLKQAPCSLHAYKKRPVDEWPWMRQYPHSGPWLAQIIGGFRFFMEDTPWLGIRSDERALRLRHLFPAGLPGRGYERTAVISIPILPEDSSDWVLKLVTPPHRYDETTGVIRSVYVIQINWSYKNNRLIESFTTLLKMQRPLVEQLCQKKGLTQAVVHKRGSGETNYGDCLRALAAYRLLKYYSYAESSLVTGEVMHGQPLYKNERAMAWAAKKTGERIARFQETGRIDDVRVPY